MRTTLALLLIGALCAPAQAQRPSSRYEDERGVYEPPTRDEQQAIPLPAGVFDRVQRGVVLIERLDKQGRSQGPACAFIDSRGYVVTDRHCVEGATFIKLNLGATGMFDLPSVVADSVELDVAILKGEFPFKTDNWLEWATGTPRPHVPVCVAVRDQSGVATASAGWSLDLDFEERGALVLSTTAPAWLGCSGSPLVDQDGRVVGVVNRLGDPVAGRSRTTARAALAADVMALPIHDPQPVATLSGDSVDSDTFTGYQRAAEQLVTYDPARAIEYARTALRYRPNDLRATYLIAQTLSSQHKDDEALEEMTKLVTARPEDPNPNLFLGHWYFRQRKYANAIVAYRSSLDIKPRAVTHFWMGTALWWKQDYLGAVRAFEEAVRLEPRHAKSWQGLAMLYGALGDNEGAQRAAERRLQHDPTDPELIAALASAHQKAGNTKEYTELVEKLRSINPYLANRSMLAPIDWKELMGKENSAPAP